MVHLRRGVFRTPKLHEMGLDEVSGADFWCNLHSFRRPLVLEGFRGQVWARGGRKIKILPPLPGGSAVWVLALLICLWTAGF